MEDPNPSFSGHYSLTADDYCENGSLGCENGSLGFMDLLGFQDFGTSTVVDLLNIPNQNHQTTNSNNVDQESNASEVLNAPATPNFSSISSESSGGGRPAGDDSDDEHTRQVVAGEDEDEEVEASHKTKKQLKPKKTVTQKRQSEPRFAFMTKSEVDHLEDGYRWRKYGQKAVKNSPFPRSYYRCTYASCNVKKRIERSLNDVSIVVTTYEGQHTHPSPVMMRTVPPAAAAAAFSTGSADNLIMPSSSFQMSLKSAHHQVNCNYSTSPLNFGNFGTSSALFTDYYGLFQDMVPSTVRKEG